MLSIFLFEVFDAYWLMEANMGILTNDMRRMLDEQQLGFIATVCPDGTPNLAKRDDRCVG